MLVEEDVELGLREQEKHEQEKHEQEKHRATERSSESQYGRASDRKR